MEEDPGGGGASITTENAAGSSTGTDVSLREHFTALRVADRRFYEERDRRYAEIATEREKALKIKETADLAALSLAREIQTYKDEKANDLRTQIERERGSYATQNDLRGAIEKIEATLKPLIEFVTQQRGKREQSGDQRATLSAGTAIIVAIGALLAIGTTYQITKNSQTPAPVAPLVVTVTTPAP